MGRRGRHGQNRDRSRGVVNSLFLQSFFYLGRKREATLTIHFLSVGIHLNLSLTAFNLLLSKSLLQNKIRETNTYTLVNKRIDLLSIYSRETRQDYHIEFFFLPFSRCNT